MNIVSIIGASGAGLYLSIFIKKKHPEWRVMVFDKSKKAGRKVLATGNGRCNLLNMNSKPEDYNHPIYMKPILEKYPFGELQFRLAELGVILTNEGDLVYPLTNSASSYVNLLEEKARQLGVEFVFESEFIDYSVGEIIEFKTSSGSYSCDKLIFATGGKSQSKLGSDGKLFPLLGKHGYQIVPLQPSLCPIKVREKVKPLSGIRHQAKVHVSASGVAIHEEEGEVLFKDDGLSGIVIFNCSAYINRLGNPDVEISLDLFPKVQFATLVKDLEDSAKKNPGFFLDAYLVPPLKDYVLSVAKVDSKKPIEKKEVFKIAKAIKDLRFSFAGSYGFENSQVTMGGISLTEVGEDLSSKRENGVYFAGEMLDVDGLCGGHNLGWCLISSLLIADSL